MWFINDINLKKQADELGVKIWQTPGFLFLMIGLVAVVVMLATYLISRNYDRPEVLIASESVVAILILIIGTSIVRVVEGITNLNKIKSEFISVASHQLRTPLSAIRWETELLLSKQRKGLSKKQLENIENISVLSARMTRLVNDLLDVVRIDQKRLVLKKTSTDLTKIICEKVDELRPLFEERNIEVVVNCKKNVPKILSDPERIRMVMDNLISNSVKYTVNQGKIEIKLFRKDDLVLFSIKDNGVGIPEEQHKRVFEKFFRSDNVVKYQTEGTGLGLYITKSIIEQSGGKIWFQSVENLGTIFNFALPIRK